MVLSETNVYVNINYVFQYRFYPLHKNSPCSLIHLFTLNFTFSFVLNCFPFKAFFRYLNKWKSFVVKAGLYVEWSVVLHLKFSTKALVLPVRCCQGERSRAKAQLYWFKNPQLLFWMARFKLKGLHLSSHLSKNVQYYCADFAFF